MELLPPSGRHLTSREEETLVAKELRDEMRIKRYLQEGGTSSQGPGKRRGGGSGAPRPEARNGSVWRERSQDGKRDKEKDQKKGDVLVGRVCLDQWRNGLGRGSEGLGTCHTVETLSVAWDAPCSPFPRFESELSMTALTGYAARDLLLLSLEGARSRFGPLLTLLPGSKRRTCALWVLLIVKAMNWLFCAG